mmetsp:Transcript_3915/g.14818  ORF Transcript_3915/g.14818 Transcript_3915/m.14818 type:complete len:136 (+) Transcript_3915:2492-2899(+)
MNDLLQTPPDHSFRTQRNLTNLHCSGQCLMCRKQNDFDMVTRVQTLTSSERAHTNTMTQLPKNIPPHNDSEPSQPEDKSRYQLYPGQFDHGEHIAKCVPLDKGFHERAERRCRGLQQKLYPGNCPSEREDVEPKY